MVDITRILVTVETLRVRNSGRYHAPCGIYDIKGESRAQVFGIGDRSEPVESTFLTYRPRVYLSNTNFPRRRRLTHGRTKKAFAPFLSFDTILRSQLCRIFRSSSIDPTRSNSLGMGDNSGITFKSI